MELTTKLSRRGALVLAFATVLTLGVASAGLAAAGEPDDLSMTLVPEMEASEDIVFFRAKAREELAQEQDVPPALVAFENRVRTLWPRLREIDMLALSRHHVDETRGYRLPAEPGEFVTRAVGRDASGALHVELRGPRLPARYDIVHRYLYVFGVVKPGGEVGRMIVTIRERIYE